MYILFVTQSNYASAFQPGRRVELPKALSIQGHRVDLISACYSWHKPEIQSASYNQVHLITIGNTPYLMSAVYSIKLLSLLIKSLLFSSTKPDVIIADYASVWPSLPLALMVRLGLIRVRFVLDVRSPPVETSVRRGMLKEIEYRSAILLAKMVFAGITVITPAVRDDIARRHRINPETIGVWSSGASPDTFNPSLTIRPADMDVFMGKFVVMHHGILTRNRGLQQAVEALELLKNEYPDIVLLLVGEGEAKGEIQAMVTAKGLGSRVFIHDAVPYERMPDYISVADVGLIPLPNIGWWRASSPQKLMEYLSMEKPVIVTDIPAHRGILMDADCAFYISSVEPDQIAVAIINAYQRRYGMRSMGKLGRDIVLKGYTWEAQANKLISFLNGLLIGKPSSYT
jgi:glycosyltransferase involved in cell wall biosynthesis